MADLLPDSFDTSSFGKQHNSKQATEGAFSFGTANRERQQQKVFISEKHERHKATMFSPGPHYSVASTVGDAPSPGFGTSKRPEVKSRYPDASNDLIGATVDSQVQKFHNTKRIHFGTEIRENPKNAELLRTHPQGGMGVGVPGAGEYDPEDLHTTDRAPTYLFGLKSKVGTEAVAQTPRKVGPGSYPAPGGIGPQPTSARRSQPSYSFGSEKRLQAVVKSLNLLDTNPNASSLGKQATSRRRSAPRVGFGSSTRDHADKTHLVMTSMDRGPAANMPRMQLSHPA